MKAKLKEMLRMHKKAVIIGGVALLFVVGAICILLMGGKSEITGDINITVYRAGYFSNGPAETTILPNYQSFTKFFGKYENTSITKKYNASYFKDKALAVVYIETNSGSNSMTNAKATVEGDTVKVDFYIKRPEIGTMDMNGFFLIAEVPKNVNDIEVTGR